jgi:hypothetical protein
MPTLARVGHGWRPGKGLTAMADERAGRTAELIKPLRVKPGSKVDLGKDFDPGYKADYLEAEAPKGTPADPHAATHGIAKDTAARASSKGRARA